MNNTNILIAAAVLVFVVAVVFLVPWVRSLWRSKRLQNKFGPEYDATVKTLGDEKKAQLELEERQKHMAELDIHPLTPSQRDHYLAEWATIQSKFVDEPGQAIVDADRLIVEVMVLRAYPVADFDQRAADLSVNYPELVSNYRAARRIADKNLNGQASTEELRHALIYYRSLFEELLETEPVKA